MAIEFKTQVESTYLLITCTAGLLDNESFFEVCEKGVAIAHGEGRRALLLDIRGLDTIAPTTTERYELGTRLAPLLVENRIKLAVVGDEPAIDPSRLGETVVKNRAGDGKAFNDFEAAKHWLIDTAE